MAKMTIPTDSGEITVEEKDIHGAFPGVTIEVEGQRVAIVELPQGKPSGTVYAYSLTDEDFAHKTTFAKPTPLLNDGVLDDVEGVIDSMEEDQDPLELTASEVRDIAALVSDTYSYSDYNEFIEETITDWIRSKNQ